MIVSVWPEWSTEVPDVSDDDPARRKITLFSKNGIRRSYKCRLQDQEERDTLEYGFYEGHIEIENPVEVIQTYCCEKIIKLLSESQNSPLLIKRLFSY